MLVLSRRKGERIVIDGPCVISLEGLQGDKAKIGITAPKTTNIAREELTRDLPQTPPVDFPVSA